MIGRRAALLGLACLPGTAWAQAGGLGAEEKLSFRVSRNDTPVGQHVLAFTRRDRDLDVRISVDIAVGFGPLTLYRYRLRGLEQWRGGMLTRLWGKTDDDGTADFVDAVRQPDGMMVAGSAGPSYRAPADALPGTHWNKDELKGPWINPQNGKLLRPGVLDAGRDNLPRPGGPALEAEHFTLSGEVRMDIWYAADGSWAALRAPAKDGSVIRYDRI